MRIAFVIFDGMTALDFVGVYDPLVRLKSMGFILDLDWEVCARSEEVTDPSSLSFHATLIDKPLSGFDMVVVAGGKSSRELTGDQDFIKWLQTAQGCRYKVSVCTGSLLLGAAGFLKDRSATSHPGVLGELRKYCSKVLDQRLVDDGDVITAGGVTASIDLGLYLCEKLAGKEARQEIQKQIDYGKKDVKAGW